MSEEYITLNEAAKRFGLSRSTISRIVSRHKDKIPTKSDTIDTRILLIEYDALKRVIQSSIKYRKDK